MAFTNKFYFVGTPVFPKDDSKRPFAKEIKKDKKLMLGMNFGIKESDTNMAFVEGFDSTQDVIKTLDTNNKKIEIKWSDRFDDEVKKQVVDFKKTIVDLGDDFGGRQEFISQYDALLFLKENFKEYKGKVAVTGDLIKEEYKGKFYDKFKFNKVLAVSDDIKNKLALTVDLFYNKESVDKSSLKDDKKVFIEGYILQYVSKDKSSYFFPMNVVFNASKYDFEIERHKKLFDYKMSYVDIQNKKYVHIPWDVRYVSGAEEAEFTEDMLTKKQKEQIELGIKNIEDFKPKKKVLGERINEYRLFDPQLTGEFAEGLVECEYTNKEFEDLLFIATADERLEEVVAKAEDSAKVETTSQDDTKVDDDDLF